MRSHLVARSQLHSGATCGITPNMISGIRWRGCVRPAAGRSLRLQQRKKRERISLMARQWSISRRTGRAIHHGAMLEEERIANGTPTARRAPYSRSRSAPSRSCWRIALSKRTRRAVGPGAWSIATSFGAGETGREDEDEQVGRRILATAIGAPIAGFPRRNERDSQ